MSGYWSNVSSPYLRFFAGWAPPQPRPLQPAPPVSPLEVTVHHIDEQEELLDLVAQPRTPTLPARRTSRTPRHVPETLMTMCATAHDEVIDMLKSRRLYTEQAYEVFGTAKGALNCFPFIPQESEQIILDLTGGIVFTLMLRELGIENPIIMHSAVTPLGINEDAFLKMRAAPFNTTNAPFANGMSEALKEYSTIFIDAASENGEMVIESLLVEFSKSITSAEIYMNSMFMPARNLSDKFTRLSFKECPVKLAKNGRDFSARRRSFLYRIWHPIGNEQRQSLVHPRAKRDRGEQAFSVPRHISNKPVEAAAVVPQVTCDDFNMDDFQAILNAISLPSGQIDDIAPLPTTPVIENYSINQLFDQVSPSTTPVGEDYSIDDIFGQAPSPARLNEVDTPPRHEECVTAFSQPVGPALEQVHAAVFEASPIRDIAPECEKASTERVVDEVAATRSPARFVLEDEPAHAEIVLAQVNDDDCDIIVLSDSDDEDEEEQVESKWSVVEPRMTSRKDSLNLVVKFMPDIGSREMGGTCPNPNLALISSVAQRVCEWQRDHPSAETFLDVRSRGAVANCLAVLFADTEVTVRLSQATYSHEHADKLRTLKGMMSRMRNVAFPEPKRLSLGHISRELIEGQHMFFLLAIYMNIDDVLQLVSTFKFTSSAQVMWVYITPQQCTAISARLGSLSMRQVPTDYKTKLRNTGLYEITK